MADRRTRRGWWRRRPRRSRNALEGPLENPAAVLRQEVRLDHSLLQDTERRDEPEPSAADLELAARLEAETAAEHAAEAEAMMSPPERDAPDTPTDESFEELIELAPKAAEESLHEEEPLRQALLDEGTSVEGLDEDAIEAEILRRPEAERG